MQTVQQIAANNCGVHVAAYLLRSLDSLRLSTGSSHAYTDEMRKLFGSLLVDSALEWTQSPLSTPMPLPGLIGPFDSNEISTHLNNSSPDGSTTLLSDEEETLSNKGETLSNEEEAL